MKKAELLNHLQEQYKQWQALLNQIEPDRMERPGAAANWSVKDMVAHLTGWQLRLNANLQAALRGEPEPPPPWPTNLETDDEINAWIYETNHGRALGEVLDESQQVFQQLLAMIEGLPDDARIERVEPAFYLVWVGDERFLVSEFFNHFQDDHEPDIRAWLAKEGEH